VRRLLPVIAVIPLWTGVVAVWFGDQVVRADVLLVWAVGVAPILPVFASPRESLPLGLARGGPGAARLMNLSNQRRPAVPLEHPGTVSAVSMPAGNRSGRGRYAYPIAVNRPR
jgi:hypothetical protein